MQLYLCIAAGHGTFWRGFCLLDELLQFLGIMFGIFSQEADQGKGF
jgi:hypothetical protein